jgi:hypothetical protein
MTTTSVSPVYTKCASDGGTCTFSGKQSVAYAADDGSGYIYYRNLSNGTQCNTSVFGDPSQGHSKSCYVAPLPSDFATGESTLYNSNGIPIGWTKCADENGICNPGTGSPVDILYGAAGNYIYANATSIPCNSTVMGDPKSGTINACYYRSPNTNTKTNTSEKNGSITVQRRTIIGLSIGLGITGFLLLIMIVVLIIVLSRRQVTQVA